MSAFLLRLKANYLEKMRGCSHFFFLDSNSFCKDLRFAHGPSLAQKPPYLVGTVLTSESWIVFGKRKGEQIMLKFTEVLMKQNCKLKNSSFQLVATTNVLRLLLGYFYINLT